MGNMGNPRYANGQLRRRHRARLRAMGGECGICHGRFGPIHYDEPSDAQHPLSFVVDEIKPKTAQNRANSCAFRRFQTATGEGWGRAPAPTHGDPCAVQRRFTHRKILKGASEPWRP